MVKAILCSYIVSMMLFLPGCGGGGTSNAVPLPMNTAIVLSASLNPTSLPIRGIEAAFVLPQNTTPILNSDGTLLIGETGLKSLKANGQISLNSATYVQATGTVHFIMLNISSDANNDLGTGGIAQLTYTTTSGTQLSAQDIQITVFKVSGPGGTPIENIVPSVSIVTYQKP